VEQLKQPFIIWGKSLKTWYRDLVKVMVLTTYGHGNMIDPVSVSLFDCKIMRLK
jgi:hypothetical protein